MVEINRCTRKNFCVECDDPDCLLAGEIEADCPKWKCDNPSMNCETCEFLKEYKEAMKKMSKELKPCPFRVHGERLLSLTIEGAYYYNETFMPCMGKECACFTENSVDAYCDRNGAFMTMTKEVTT